MHTLQLHVLLLPTHTYRAQDTLGELLKELEQHSDTIRFYAMTNILAVHSQADGEGVLYSP